jgi:hypothetical protein
MKNPGVPLTLDDLNDQPERREILQILNSLNAKRKQAATIQEKAQIKKQMIDMARKNGLEREVIVMLEITPEEWRLSSLISAQVSLCVESEIKKNET